MYLCLQALPALVNWYRFVSGLLGLGCEANPLMRPAAVPPLPDVLPSAEIQHVRTPQGGMYTGACSLLDVRPFLSETGAKTACVWRRRHADELGWMHETDYQRCVGGVQVQLMSKLHRVANVSGVAETSLKRRQTTLERLRI